jgi:phosphate transport system permease protein
MPIRTRWRYLVNNVMLSLTGVCAFLTISILFFILAFLVYNGFSSVDWAFFTQLPKPPGENGGGMANAIVGSGLMVLIGSLIGIPFGFLGGIYLSEYDQGWFADTVRYTTDLLNGVPSIVLGIVAWTLLVEPLKTFSAWAGGVALSLILIPVVMRATEQFLRAIPVSLREGALALGANKATTILTVVVPAARRGIMTGMILGVARISGETAPLLFTSLNNQFWAKSLKEPIASLPVMIYSHAIAPYDDWHRQAWAAGLVLIVLVLTANIAARLVVSRNAG